MKKSQKRASRQPVPTQQAVSAGQQAGKGELTMTQVAENQVPVKLSTQVRMPIEVYSKVDQEAKAGNKSAGALILEIVAKHYGIAVAGAPSRSKKYASEEDKKAANKARREERRDLIKNLLAQYQAQADGAASTNGSEPVEVPA